MTFTPAHLEEGFATTWAKRRWARRLRAGESREPIFLESSTPHAGITAPMGLRLSAGPGPAPDVWLRMQVQRDHWLAQRARQPKVRPFPHGIAKRASVARA
jgi:hypothetical protein